MTVPIHDRLINLKGINAWAVKHAARRINELPTASQLQRLRQRVLTEPLDKVIDFLRDRNSKRKAGKAWNLEIEGKRLNDWLADDLISLIAGWGNDPLVGSLQELKRKTGIEVKLPESYYLVPPEQRSSLLDTLTRKILLAILDEILLLCRTRLGQRLVEEQGKDRWEVVTHG